MKSAAVKLQLLGLCLLLLTGIKLCDGNGPVIVIVEEDSDVILPCCLNTKEDIVSKLFDWKKDGQKEVFLYDGGLHYNNGRPGQDEQFKGRVSHFQDKLKSGDASIIIRKTKVADSGDYTCDFPRLQPGQIFHIHLVVAATAKPNTTIVDLTDAKALLQCEVRGASPEPKVEWQDSAGNILPAEEPHVSERGGSYDITLQTTVNKTDYYRCVATQEKISHQTHAEIYVSISDNMSKWTRNVLIGGVTGLILLILVFVCFAQRYKIRYYVRRCQMNLSRKSGLKSTETGFLETDEGLKDEETSATPAFNT